MSIASMVVGQNLLNSTNPDVNIYQATPTPQVQDWTQNAKQLNTFSPPGWKKFDFQRYGAPDPVFQKYGQQAPQYKGLMEGDYNTLESSLRTPGEIAAKQAYDSARKTLAAGATNRGMYGSSNYTNQLVGQAAQPYMDTLASNAAKASATRYGMQQGDLQFGQSQAMQAWQNLLNENNLMNQFAYNVWNSRLNENNLMNQLMGQQNLAENGFNMQGSLAAFGSGNDAIRYGNNLLSAGYENAWRAPQWDVSEKSRLANLLLGFAGATDQLTDSLKSQQVSKMSQQDGGMGSLFGGVGSLAGTALSFIPGAGPFLSAGVGAATKSLPSGFGANYIDTPGTTMTGGSFRAMS